MHRCKVEFFAAAQLINTYIEAGQERQILCLEKQSHNQTLLSLPIEQLSSTSPYLHIEAIS